MEELYSYVVKEITKIFDLEAQRQGVKTQSSDIHGVFGARLKARGKEVEVAVIPSDILILLHLSSGSHSFKDDYFADCKTKEDFDEKITKIEEFTKDCFALKIKKKS